MVGGGGGGGGGGGECIGFLEQLFCGNLNGGKGGLRTLMVENGGLHTLMVEKGAYIP